MVTWTDAILQMVALVASVSIGLCVLTGIGWVVERITRPLWRKPNENE